MKQNLSNKFHRSFKDYQSVMTQGLQKTFEHSGVSIRFEVGSWLKKNNRLYEEGAVRPINVGGSGGMLPQKILKSEGSEMPFPAFWAPNYYASTSGNYSLCMAIRCEIKLKKHSGFNIRYWANDFTNKT